MKHIQIATLDELAEGTGRAFDVAGRRIAVFRADDELYAIDDTCSHAEASLSAGEFDPEELCVDCPLHGSRFDLRTGQPRTLPAFKPVATYRVFTQSDAVFVELDD